jgi:UPF0716 protein FxsA
MFQFLFVLFFILPLIEIYLLMHLGTLVGLGNTIFLILFTGFLGAYLARRQGLKTLIDIQTNLNSGQLPTESLMDGAMILLAGAMLITPGFVTDAIGFFLLIPAGRQLVRGLLFKHFQNFTQRQNYAKTKDSPDIKYFDQDDV